MSYKAIALAVVFTAASITAGHAANAIDNGKFNKNLNNWTSKNASLGLLDNSNAASLGTGSKLGSLVQIFSVAKDGLFDLGFNYTALSKMTVTVTDITTGVIAYTTSLLGQNKSFSGTLSLLADSDYSLSFSTKQGVVDNVSVSRAVAVPGPEAGAGLGALALGGVALWTRRGRKATNLAA